MELTLNLAWALMAVVLVRLWLRAAPSSSACPRSQMVALLMLIVILFPVISVTDDLGAALNPAELDCCARRHYAVYCSYSIFPAAATLPPPVFAELTFGFLRFVMPGNHPAPSVEIPAMASIQNRPPPVA
jgi:hypothetical protein